MSKSLPARPNLEHLKAQAKDLLKASRSGDPEATQRFASLPNPPTTPALHDAQSAIARKYGFDSWAKLTAEVDEVLAKLGITDEVADKFVNLICNERPDAARRMLELYPGLPRYSPVTSAVCAEPALVAKWLESHKPDEKLPPLDMPMLGYVCNSVVTRFRPDRYDAQLECGRLLLDAGADPNTMVTLNEYTISILWGATSVAQHLGLTELLLERGANPNDGESVYHAAQHDLPDILESLLKHGAEISALSEAEGNTPLYFLAGHRPIDANGDTAMAGIRWLLEHGADPNVTCKPNDEAPLHVICRGGWGADIIEMFLKHGANPNLARNDGITPYAIAAGTGNVDAAEALARAGADTTLTPPQRFLAAAAGGQVAEARDLIKSLPGGLEGVRREAGWIMCRLGEQNKADGLRTMLELGFDPDTVGQWSETPLHLASFIGRADPVKVLLEYNAPLDVKDKTFDSTPLGWALYGATYHRSTTGDYAAIARALLEAGANRDELVYWLDQEEFPSDLREALQDLAH